MLKKLRMGSHYFLDHPRITNVQDYRYLDDTNACFIWNVNVYVNFG